MKTRQDKRTVKLDFFLNYPFWTYIKKSSHSPFDAWSFLLAHIHVIPSEGLKDFVKWSDFMVHGAN
jgi:hypothetical protein